MNRKPTLLHFKGFSLSIFVISVLSPAHFRNNSSSLYYTQNSWGHTVPLTTPKMFKMVSSLFFTYGLWWLFGGFSADYRQLRNVSLSCGEGDDSTAVQPISHSSLLSKFLENLLKWERLVVVLRVYNLRNHLWLIKHDL